jgi:hypothetical protein
MTVRKIFCAGPFVVLFLFFAAPAFAQFEVNPDHFDNEQNQTPQKPVTIAKKKTPQVNPASQTGSAHANAAKKSTTANAAASSKSGARPNANSTATKKSATTAASHKSGKPAPGTTQSSRLKAQLLPTQRE